MTAEQSIQPACVPLRGRSGRFRTRFGFSHGKHGKHGPPPFPRDFGSPTPPDEVNKRFSATNSVRGGENTIGMCGGGGFPWFSVASEALAGKPHRFRLTMYIHRCIYITYASNPTVPGRRPAPSSQITGTQAGSHRFGSRARSGSTRVCARRGR